MDFAETQAGQDEYMKHLEVATKKLAESGPLDRPTLTSYSYVDSSTSKEYIGMCLFAKPCGCDFTGTTTTQKCV